MAITKKQKDVFDFVKAQTERNLYAPSLKEIAKRFHFASVSTAHYYITKLKKAGFLKRQHHKARAISIAEKASLVKIPLVGVIAAGQPIEAIESPHESITVAQSDLGASGTHYALRVHGDSMIGEGIFDGDIVVIRKQETAENGQTVVAIIDENEATLKKIYREKGRFRLQPANQSMLPIYRREVEVRGIVVKIIRDLENHIKDNTLAYKKRIFLDQIRSANIDSQNRYKRVVLSPIRYAGGKSLAVGHVVELLPDTITRVVSPFFGGGSIEIAMSKELGLEVVGYDVFDILCNYWKFQIEKPAIIYKKLQELRPDKKTFEKIRLILNDVWKKKINLDPLTLAVYYVYNFNLSYGPGFMGWSSDIYLNDTRYKRILEKIRDFEPKNLKVECGDFQEVIKNHPDDFLYCDPPYYLGEDSKMFRGIYPMRNIPVHHNGFAHEALRDLLKNHKGGFILSYNNCPTVREYYKEFQQSFPTWQYTMGQGETRIGLNRKNGNGNHIKESHEILIFSPPQNAPRPFQLGNFENAVTRPIDSSPIKPTTLEIKKASLPYDPADSVNFKSPFFTSHLVTYIGNKRRLLPFLYKGFYKIRERLGKKKLLILDGFAGSGAAARLLKTFASELYVNDMEDYAETLNKAYLANQSEIKMQKLEAWINWLNKNRSGVKSRTAGFIERNYAPRDDNNIQVGERVFYTNKNAKIIDNLRRLIDRVPEPYRHFCLASLLVKASVHTNTSGVFKGFHKRNGNGHFGGNGENALSRIKKEITLDTPLFSDFECPVSVHKKDVNALVRDSKLPVFDLAYYDPPYNQHPYGSNYFMLNIINGGKAVPIQDGVSGIIQEWKRSAYNKRHAAEEAMSRLLADTRARFIAISYNDEGIIPIANFKKILSQHGKWELMEQDYNTYRGSRNLRGRDIKVKELLWILEKR